MIRPVLLAGVALWAATPAIARDTPAPDSAAPPASDGQNGTGEQSKGDIVITGVVDTSERDVLSGTSILKGEALARSIRPTIGETLEHLPGVSATSFGPSASRPILRGFQGDRIRVLSDGIGSIDVSTTSVDHAVAINPLLAERIEVLRGPSALLYGSSAVGGVINVIDTRIPRSVPENGYRLNGMGTYGSAANERSGSAAADVALGKYLVFHADGSYLKSDDMKIGGYALSPRARAQALATAATNPHDAQDPESIDFAGNAAIRGTLPNSAAETWTAGAGLALITDTGSLGISYSHYASTYGIPVRFATEPGQEQEAPRLDLLQNRFDLRAEVDTQGGFLDKIRLRAAYANYRHFELEEDGEIGTAFYNKGIEGRLEFLQARKGGWSGASGVQFFNRAFDVEGDEAFLPRNETSQTGLFTLQQFVSGPIRAEAGLRYELTDLTARGVDGDLRFFNGRRHFETVSGSLGASYGFSDNWRIGLNLSRTERAPSAEELFANGPHAGTEAYELGNPFFKSEKSWGIEATLHGHGLGFNIDASAYYNWFSDFIFENQVAQSVCAAAAAPSGRDVDLPCFRSSQADARYYGFELDVSGTVATVGRTRINLDGIADYVHAEIVDLGPAPRIPPLRLLGGVEAQSDTLTGRVEVEHVFDQNRTAAFETPTDQYTMVNASLAFSPWGKDSKTSLILSANNLFDVDARRAASFLKDFAPLAGRDIRVTVKIGL